MHAACISNACPALPQKQMLSWLCGSLTNAFVQSFKPVHQCQPCLLWQHAICWPELLIRHADQAAQGCRGKGHRHAAQAASCSCACAHTRADRADTVGGQEPEPFCKVQVHMHQWRSAQLLCLSPFHLLGLLTAAHAALVPLQHEPKLWFALIWAGHAHAAAQHAAERVLAGILVSCGTQGAEALSYCH